MVGVFGLALARPKVGDAFFRAIERCGTHLAARQGLSLAVIAVAPVILRLAFLAFSGVPLPKVHDEFSYLLAADTFAHGRLTNAPHPMWIFFDTFHVNQNPTYMSKYPPGQGAFLALGQLLGHPWIGVLLSVAAMCAAVLWMLQAWLPARWALLGAVLVVFRLGLFTYWMNSYWGGAVAAIGGALVVGALPRILRRTRPRDALWMALGAALLMNSRPLEGLFLCLPVAAVLVGWFWSKRRPTWAAIASRFMFPFAALFLLGLVFDGYYDWRVTGDPFLLPYVLNQRTYDPTPAFVLLQPRAPLAYLNAQFDTFYNHWVRAEWIEAQRAPVRHALSILGNVVHFFFWPELCVPLAVLPWLIKSKKVLFLCAQAAFSFLAFATTPWFNLHYAAPLTATMFAAITLGLRKVRRWEFRGRAVGLGLTRAVVLCTIVLAPFRPAILGVGPPLSPGLENRARLESQLDRTTGEHLVIVRYTPAHDPGCEWVYNRADIDAAKIVWAREIPGMDITPLLHYFRGRQVWLVQADATPPTLERYSPDPAASGGAPSRNLPEHSLR